MKIKEKLTVGEYYFFLHYSGPERNAIPYIDTYIYIGRNLFKKQKKNKEDEYYFQEAKSFFKYGNIIDNQDYRKCRLIFFPEDLLELHIFDRYSLPNELIKISPRLIEKL